MLFASFCRSRSGVSTLFFFFWLTTAIAQTGHLRGLVRSAQGEPVAGASIRLPSVGTSSGEDGWFDLRRLPPGVYDLRVSAIGYQSVSRSVTVRAGETTTVQLSLAAEIRDLSEVTVTSRRTAPSLNKIDVPARDLPVATSAVTQLTLAQRGSDDLGDALKNTTGVRSNTTYGGFQHFTIRGFNNFVLLVDGVRDERHNISTSAPNTNLANVERIEVLKGPASVLFGHSALGGVINIVRKKPTADFRGDFSVSAGSYQTRRLRAGAGGAVTSALRYRVDFGASDAEGFRQAGVKTNNAYAALAFIPTAKDYFLLTVGANDDRYQTDTGLPVLPDGSLVPGMKIDTRYNDPADFLKHKRTDYQLRYVRELRPNLHLSDHLSYSSDNIDYLSTEQLTFNARKDSLTRSPPLYFNHLTKPLQNQLELTYDVPTGKIKQKLLAGYSFSFLDRRTYSATITGPGKGAKIPVASPLLNQGFLGYVPTLYRASEETVHGVYLQDWLSLSDQWKALIGLRYDSFSGTYYTDKVDKDRNVTEKGAKTTIRTGALTYRAGLVYQPVTPLSVYASYSTYFKPSRRIAPNGETFDPETGYQAEAGTRLELTSGWTATVSAYYMRKDNQVESLAGGIYKRIGSAESKGAEAEVHGNPLPGLDITAGYTFTKARYLPFAGSDVSPVAGNHIVLAPEHLVNIWLHYELRAGKLSGLSAGAGLNAQSDTYANSANTYVLPAWTTADLSFGYRIGKIGLQLNVNNVFDKTYFTNVIITNQFYPGMPRNYLLTLKYTF